MQAVIHFEDGAVALVAWAMGSPAPLPRFIIEGETGGIRADWLIQKPKDGEKQGGIVQYFRTKDGRWDHKPLPYVKADWVQYYRNVAQALTGKAALAVRPEEALRHVAICEAAYKSVRLGKPVPVPREVFPER